MGPKCSICEREFDADDAVYVVDGKPACLWCYRHSAAMAQPVIVPHEGKVGIGYSKEEKSELDDPQWVVPASACFWAILVAVLAWRYFHDHPNAFRLTNPTPPSSVHP